MIAMVRYELKKVFGSVGGKIALILYIAVLALSCWLSSTGALNVEVKWVNEQGESEYGPSAVKKLREAQKEWEGWVDQNKLSRVIQENQRINATPEAKSDIVQQNEIAYSWKQGFAPIRKILNESYSNGFREYDYYTAEHNHYRSMRDKREIKKEVLHHVPKSPCLSSDRPCCDRHCRMLDFVKTV